MNCQQVGTVTIRSRTCNNPSIANGGQPCDTSIAGNWQSQKCDAATTTVKDCSTPDTDCYFDQPCVGWDFGGWQVRSGTTPNSNTGPSNGMFSICNYVNGLNTMYINEYLEKL